MNFNRLLLTALILISPLTFAQSEIVNKKLPMSLKAETLFDQEMLDIAKHYPNQIIYIDLWAHWCASCAKTFPVMQKLQQKFGDKLAIVAVATGEEDERELNINYVNRVMGDEEPVFDVIWGKESIAGQLYDLYAFQGMPATFIVDTNGMIRYFHSGAEDTLEQDMSTLINLLLNE